MSDPLMLLCCPTCGNPYASDFAGHEELMAGRMVCFGETDSARWLRKCRPTLVYKPLTNETVTSSSDIPMRRFVIDRSSDITGISGTGVILYGIEWYPGGPVDVYWLRTKTTGQYPNMEVVRSTHCYNDNARVVYLDSDLTPLEVKEE